MDTKKMDGEKMLGGLQNEIVARREDVKKTKIEAQKILKEAEEKVEQMIEFAEMKVDKIISISNRKKKNIETATKKKQKHYDALEEDLTKLLKRKAKEQRQVSMLRIDVEKRERDVEKKEQKIEEIKQNALNDIYRAAKKHKVDKVNEKVKDLL